MVKRSCLVLGSALDVFSDVDRALAEHEYDAVIACKDAGMLWPGELEAWVTLHPDRQDKMAQTRHEYGYPPARRVFSNPTTPKMPGVTDVMEYRFPGCKMSPSSGLFAVRVAFHLGYERVVLCGIPLDRDAGRLNRGAVWNGWRMYQGAFDEAFDHLRDNVRSMSGWTQSRLGSPTTEWLEG